MPRQHAAHAASPAEARKFRGSGFRGFRVGVQSSGRPLECDCFSLGVGNFLKRLGTG